MVKRKRSINRNSSRDKESLSTLVKCRKSNSSVLAKSCNINPKSALCLYSNENCEFCDSSFNSKLEVLIHNATHIIIPLIRFTSKNDLDNLTTTKYLRKKERSDVSDRKKSNMIVIGNVKQQCEEINEVICISDESDLETPLSNVDLEDFIPSARVTKLASKSINDVLGSLVADCKVNLGEPMVLSDNENVDSNNLLTSFTNDCKVNLGHHLRFEESPNDTRILLNDEEKLLLPRSVHYDELKKPSLHTCHLCRQKFHNEFDLAIHTAKHLTIRRTDEDTCIVCEMAPRLQTEYIPVCLSCGTLHTKEKINVLKNMNLSSGTPPKEVTTYLCDVCFMFRKAGSKSFRQRHMYKIVLTVLEDIKYSDTKYNCEDCNKEYNNIKIVQKSWKLVSKTKPNVNNNLASKIHFEDEDKHWKPKVLTNANRLKNIRNRIKIMNKIRRF